MNSTSKVICTSARYGLSAPSIYNHWYAFIAIDFEDESNGMQIEKLHLNSHLSFHPAFEDTLRHPDLKVDLGLCAVNLAVQYKRWVIYNIVDSMINHGL